MGVQGLIFNCKSWWSGPGGLGQYSYCYKNGHRRSNLDRTQAHKDHIHIELNKPGARKNTSFWQQPAGALGTRGAPLGAGFQHEITARHLAGNARSPANPIASRGESARKEPR